MSEASADLQKKSNDPNGGDGKTPIPAKDSNPTKDSTPIEPIIFGIEFFMKPDDTLRERDIRIPPGPNVANPFFPGESYRSRMDITRMSSGMQMTVAENGIQGLPNTIPGQIMMINTSKKLVRSKDDPNSFIDGPVIVIDGLSSNVNTTVFDHLSSAWKDAFGNDIKVIPTKIYNFDASKIKTMVYFAVRSVEAKLAVVIPQINGGKIPTREQVDQLPGTYLLGRGRMAGHTTIQAAENAAQSLQI